MAQRVKNDNSRDQQEKGLLIFRSNKQQLYKDYQLSHLQ